MKSVKIGDIVIGESERPLVIPEMGINHEGSLETAKEMVDAAHRAGARIIKHQTHIVEDEMSGAAKKVIPGNADVSIYERISGCAGWFIGSYTEQQCLYRSDGIGSKVSRETFYRLYGTYRSGYCMFDG